MRIDGTMTKSKSLLSRDLLNLALILAFLRVDPEAYLGLTSPRYMQAESIYSSHKILDDLSALGRYNGHINPQVEISAYILNSAETLNFSAVIENENNIMDYDDSGVSDVDSNSSGAASPRHENEEVKIEETNDYSAMFDTNESSNIFRDLDDLLESELKVESNEYAPDEEDVENQLMHIDDQLIRLDEDIEDISGHLDIFDSTTSSDSLGVPDNLLTHEEEIFLFESMPEVINPLHGWQLEQNSAQIDELIAAGLPSPLMPSPFQDDRDDVEKPKKVEYPVKQEQPEHPDEEQLYTEEIDQYNWLLSPTDSLASASLIPNDLIKEEEEEAAAASHLLDHNYAMSSFDECFGGDMMMTPPSTSSSSFKSELNFDYLGGAAALSPAPSSVDSHNRESRDERKARELNLPFRVSEIIDLPIDAFNDLVAGHTLTEEQLVLCRDIRRRGKNKVAAQNCRKRKMDLISQLEEEVNRARHQKQVLLAEREELYRLRTEWTHKLMHLESSVLEGLSKNSNDYTLDYSGATVKVTTRLSKPTKA